MEGGNKNSINLESPLDISSSDMLVSVGQPTFQHNWQRFQGKFLPNSLRFEKNGWAAGWNVYDFEYNQLRIKNGSKYFGITKLNENPSYMLNIYDTDSGVNSVGHIIFTPDSSVLSVSNGTAVMSGNKITGSVNSKDFTLTWDPDTQTVTSDDPIKFGVDLKMNSDKTYSITVTDLESSFTVDNKIYPPTSLNGTGLQKSLAYTKYFDGEHSWKGITYDGTSVTAPYATDTIAFTVDDTNRLTFSYDASTNETLGLAYSFEQYYLAFNECTLKPQTGTNKLIYTSSSEQSWYQAYNRWDGTVIPDRLLAKDPDGITVTVWTPVWLTVTFKPEINYAKGAKWPDNVGYTNVIMKTTSQFCKFTATSVFDNTPVVTEDTTPGTGYVPLKMNWRYNRIETDNTIEACRGWNIRRNKIRGTTWCFSTKQFTNFSSSSGRSKIQKLLGGIRSGSTTSYLYNIKSCTFNGNTYYQYNNWADWSDINNAVYTMEDISGIRSIRKVGTADMADVYDDEDYVNDTFLSEEVLASTYVASRNSLAITTYVADAPSKYYDNTLYNSGVYVGGTYEEVETDLSSGENFWPFDRVPRFNYAELVGQHEEDDPANPGSTITVDDYEYHSGVYYVDTDKHSIITDLEEFKKLVRGSFNGTTDPQNNILIPNTSYKIIRVVKQYEDVFDFDYDDINKSVANQTAFEARWELWYPNQVNPATLDKEASDDETYLNYSDIEVQYDQKPSMKRTAPGIVVFEPSEKNTGVKYCDYALNTCNNKNIILWQEVSTDASAKVFHNHLDVTDRYNLGTASKPGSLLIDDWRNADWFNPDAEDSTITYVDLPGYFERDTSGRFASYSDNGDRYSCTAEARSGYVGIHGLPKDNKCWAKEVAVAYSQDRGELEVMAFRAVKKHDDEYDFDYTEYVEDRYYEYELDDGIEQLARVSVCSDVDDGMILTHPLKGNMIMKIKYTDLATKSGMTSNVDKYFSYESIPSSYIINQDKIWIDRDDLRHSYAWFKLEKDAIIPDQSGEGFINFKLKSLSEGAELYYVKKKLSTSTGQEIRSTQNYPPIAGVNGNMAGVSEDALGVQLHWVPEIISLPNTITTLFSSNVTDLYHTFYTDGVTAMTTGISYKLGDISDVDPDTKDIPVTLTINGTDIVYTFNTVTLETKFPSTTLSMSNADVTFSETNAVGAIVSVPIEVLCHFTDISGRFAMSDPDTLISWQNSKFLCENDIGILYNYDMLRRKIVGKDVLLKVLDYPIHQNIRYDDIISTTITALLSSVVDGYLSFEFAGEVFSIDIAPLIDGSDTMEVRSTDIREPSKTKIISKIKSSDEFQLIRQQWNTTVEVEQFWWIDDLHILELNQYNWVLKRKTSELDDWNGDRFEKIYEITRTDLLNSSILRFEVTNTYNTEQRGLLLLYDVYDTYTVRVNIYDPRENLRRIGTVYFKLEMHQIGDTLNSLSLIPPNTALFNTYSVLTAQQLLVQAQWSNTITDGRLFIGCHISNNFDQWTAIFSIDDDFECEKCIQGYGYVSIKGDLTGGMIPADYFDEDCGFNSVVEPINVLSKVTDDNSSEDVDDAYKFKDNSDLLNLNVVDAHVVGTAERQWYIQKELYGIVSHLEYNKDGKYNVQVLPMTNKYDSVYKSPSFMSSMLGDMAVEMFPFSNLISFPSGADKIWNTIMGICGYPTMFCFNPRFARLTYLQQTLGQYAYVHYNSSESMETPEAKSTAGTNMMGEGGDTGIVQAAPKAQAPVLSDDYTFGKQILTQAVRNTNQVTKFSVAMFYMFAPALQHIDRNLIVNGELNQSAVTDVGKKYSQNALENLGALAVKSVLTESSEQGMSSQVVGIKSLDMFYSTSDKQHVYAGPGFVEHQFVADCVAQSVVDTAAEGNVQQVSFVIKALTMYQGLLEVKLENLAADALDKAADATAAQMVCGTSLGGVAVGIHAAAAALRAAAAATETAFNMLGELLDIVCARGITCEELGKVSRYQTSTEGKHKYGEKNEVFMWPCWGIPSDGLKYTDETVNAAIKQSIWRCSLDASKYWMDPSNITHTNICMGGIELGDNIVFSSLEAQGKANNLTWNLSGDVPFYQASCYGSNVKRDLPKDMAMIEGVPLFLPTQAFKNENIGVSEPVFAPSLFQDYIIDKDWNLSQCCTYGLQQWVTCKDTKITNCPPSNMRITNEFCGIATSYSAVEIRRGLSKDYMRPYAITPNTLLFNATGYNSILDNKLYHACDGLSYRIVEWTGTPGLNKNVQTFLYGFQVNDRFKRSNKFPANEMQGCFNSEPVQYIKSIDKFWTKVTIASKEKGMEAGTIGEDKDLTRWAIPIFTEPVTTLPAAVKTLTAMPLVVVEGITGLVTDLGNNQIAYKAPLSVDFTIGKNVYRQTEEYICSVQTQNGVDIVTDLIPSLGLKYIGATPTEAYFYSKATRCYYMFSGSNLIKMDMMERFRDIQKGYWDFVNQEVVMPCLMTFKRLNKEVEDKDTETDNIIVPMLSKGQVSGELIPPLTTIFNDRSWYKAVSLPSGFAYQGPNRVIINRSVFVEYMLDSLKGNLGKWKRMDREKYVTKREYPEVYDVVNKDVSNGVDGWTYNPFLLVTSALGTDEDTDCLFEWVITFCWPIEMDLIYGVDNFAVVNVMAETMTPGGKQMSRPTHIFLTKELFTRNGNYGYYSFRFQSKNGAGNRERLHIWSDQYIAISKLDCEAKTVTQRRTEILVQQLDVQKLKEL